MEALRTVGRDLTVESARETVKLLNFVASFAVGGTELQLLKLSLGLDPARFDVRFGSIRRWGQLQAPLEERGIPIDDYGVTSLRSFGAAAAQWRLARDIRRRRIDIVHTYNFHANLFAIVPAKLAGARVVASIRDMGVYLTGRDRLLQRTVCRFADQIIVNATAIRDWLVSTGYRADRIEVIPNGIDVSRFEGAPRADEVHLELGLPAGTPLVGFIGRLAPLKGIEDFLAAAARIANRLPDVRFLVVGDANDPAYSEYIRRYAAETGIADRIVFTGYRSDIERVLAALRIVVQPSLSEGLSNAILEAMAAGVPLVATRVGGTGEAVESGVNGLLVPPSDPEAIVDAVCRIYESPALAADLAAHAHASILKRFSMQRVVERTTAVYERLLSDDPHGLAPHSSLSPV